MAKEAPQEGFDRVLGRPYGPGPRNIRVIYDLFPNQEDRDIIFHAEQVLRQVQAGELPRRDAVNSLYDDPIVETLLTTREDQFGGRTVINALDLVIEQERTLNRLLDVKPEIKPVENGTSTSTQVPDPKPRFSQPPVPRAPRPPRPPGLSSDPNIIREIEELRNNGSGNQEILEYYASIHREDVTISVVEHITGNLIKAGRIPSLKPLPKN